MIRPVILGAALAAAIGCRDRSTYLVVQVEAAPELSEVRQLLIEVGHRSASALVGAPDPPAASPLLFPSTFSLEMPEAGLMDLHIEALNKDGAAVATADVRVEVAAAATSSATVRLEPGPAGCGNRAADSGESDVDCGGPCRPCTAGKKCAGATDCASGACRNARCEHATGPPRWLPGPDMLTRRYNGGAALGSDGRIYVMGGFYWDPNAEAMLDAVEALDPSSESPRWVSMPPLSVKRYGMAAAALGGKIYAVGGRDSQYVHQDVVDVFDIATGQWQQPSKLPSPRYGMAVVAVPDERRIYVIGGESTPNMTTAKTDYYDVASDRWAVGPDLKLARQHFGATYHRGEDGTPHIYAVGGAGNSVEAYTFSPPGWNEVAGADLEPVRDLQALVSAPDGRVYSLGGGVPSPGPPVATVDAYLPAANVWMRVADLARARQMPSAVVAPDGRIWVMGGGVIMQECCVRDSFNTVEVYGPVARASASRAHPGATLRVTGSNFASQARVRVYLGRKPSGRPLGSGLTDSEGKLDRPLIIVVPPAPPGLSALTVIDERSAYPVFIPLEIQ